MDAVALFVAGVMLGAIVGFFLGYAIGFYSLARDLTFRR